MKNIDDTLADKEEIENELGKLLEHQQSVQYRFNPFASNTTSEINTLRHTLHELYWHIIRRLEDVEVQIKSIKYVVPVQVEIEEIKTKATKVHKSIMDTMEEDRLGVVHEEREREKRKEEIKYKDESKLVRRRRELREKLTHIDATANERRERMLSRVYRGTAMKKKNIRKNKSCRNKKKSTKRSTKRN